ncbi:MAG TPA: GNAT family N-acetyltransferase [Nitrolancea sp.]|nr:GNAT family N-acetyltransferase [Nitrolancea sp.]
MTITVRPVELPNDRERILALDRSFVTDRIYHVSRTTMSFSLEEVRVNPPLLKQLPLDYDLGEGRAWDDGLVAELDGVIAGFAAWKHEAWNRSTVLWHLYVASGSRGRGIGRQLIELVIDHARAARSRAVWLETSSVNAPAIAFYTHLGFTFCGLDTALYDPASPASGETALYFVYPLE